MKKDKAKVLDEIWDDNRIRGFLSTEAPSNGPQDQDAMDHACLLRAYRSMRDDDFGRFTVFFQQDGRNLDAKDAQGKSLADLVSQHRQSGAYLEHLLAAGATAPATAAAPEV